MSEQIIVGNAAREGSHYRGWFMGHFIDPSGSSGDPRSTTTLELKWGIHTQGDRRTEWTTHTRVTSLSILIQGQFCLEFPDRHILLQEPGDYALWSPGVEHCWEAKADAIVLTVRFPSV